MGGDPRKTWGYLPSGWGPVPLRLETALTISRVPRSFSPVRTAGSARQPMSHPCLLPVGGTGVLGINSLVLRTLKLQKEQNEKS